jgi:hypothetical protein
MENAFEKVAISLKDPKTLALILGASGLSGLAGGYLSSKNEKAKRGETRAERRKRIMRNALYSALAGGSAAALGAQGVESLGNVKPDVDTSIAALAKKYGLTSGVAGLTTGGALYGPELFKKNDREIARRSLQALASESLKTNLQGLSDEDVRNYLAHGYGKGGDTNKTYGKIINAIKGNLSAKHQVNDSEKMIDNLLIRAGYRPHFNEADTLSDILPKGLASKFPQKAQDYKLPPVKRMLKQFFMGDKDLEKLMQSNIGHSVGIDTPYGKRMSPAEAAARNLAPDQVHLKGALNPRIKAYLTLAAMAGAPMLASQTLYEQPEL